MLLLIGKFIFGGVLSNCCKTREQCSLHNRHAKRRACKNRPFILHTFAFGGRGIFTTGKYRCFSCCNKGKIFTRFCSMLLLTLVLTLGTAILVHKAPPIFNVTLGYPGEGPNNWSADAPNLSMATWNARSLTFERFYYCRGLNFDVLALTELWRSSHKFVDGTTRWTHSKPKLNKSGGPIFPDDSAAGVGILLSERAQSKYLEHGSPCERITWVRLKGPVVNIFVIAIYVPHRLRVEPAQHNTLGTLSKLLKQVPKSDCIIILGDLNEQLPPNIDNHTGKWAFGSASKNADDIIDIMRLHDLYAINTKFQPAKHTSNATYISINKKGANDKTSGKYQDRQCKQFIKVKNTRAGSNQHSIHEARNAG